MKNLIILLLILLLPCMILAQEANVVDDTTANETVVAETEETNSEGIAPRYREYVLDTFEEESLWDVEISSDVGYTTIRHLPVQAAAKNDEIEREIQPENAGTYIDQNDQSVDVDEKVLGLRVDFVKRAWESIVITPDAPIQLRGHVKSISFLSSGRLYKHQITVLLRNYDGNPIEIPAGQVYHYGWKRYSVDIPSYVDQLDPHYPKKIGGLVFEGFRIDLHAMDIDESYYVYFDDLRMVSNVGPETFEGLHFVKAGTEEYQPYIKHLEDVENIDEIRFDYRNDMEDMW